MNRVVILGGGYGGVVLTKKLLKLVSKHKLPIKVVLIDRNDYQVLLPALPKCISNPDSKVLVKFSDVFKGFGDNFEFIQGEVSGISAGSRKVVLSDTREVEYDDLVIALGAQPNDFGIQGLRENAIMFWNEKDTIKYINKLRSFTEKGVSPRIVIVGAGPVGLEVASETCYYLKKLGLTPNIRVVEAKDRALPALPEELSKTITRFLEKLGVKFEYNCPVCNVYDSNILSSDGRTFDYDILVWSSGVKANDITKKILDSEVERGPQGKLVTDEFYRVSKERGIWAIGDICVNSKYGMSFTNLAQFAIQMAEYCAVNIVNKYLGKPLVPAKLTFKGIVIQLSKFKASAYIPKPFKIILSPSFIGVLLREFVDINYLINIRALGKVKPLKEIM